MKPTLLATLLIVSFLSILEVFPVTYQPAYYSLLSRYYQAINSNALQRQNANNNPQGPHLTYQPFMLALVNRLYATVPNGLPDLSNILLSSATDIKQKLADFQLFEMVEQSLAKYESYFADFAKNFNIDSKYIPYIETALEISMYIIPGLNAYKGLKTAWKLTKVALKVVEKHRNGESPLSIGVDLAPEILATALRRRNVDEENIAIPTVAEEKKPNAEDTHPFAAFADFMRSLDLPPLSENEENMIRHDVTNIVDDELADELNYKEERAKLIDSFVAVVKYLATYEITSNMVNSME